MEWIAIISPLQKAQDISQSLNPDVVDMPKRVCVHSLCKSYDLQPACKWHEWLECHTWPDRFSGSASKVCLCCYASSYPSTSIAPDKFLDEDEFVSARNVWELRLVFPRAHYRGLQNWSALLECISLSRSLLRQTVHASQQCLKKVSCKVVVTDQSDRSCSAVLAPPWFLITDSFHFCMRMFA